jgi:hypothetical protein
MLQQHSSSSSKKRPTKISRYFEVTPGEKSICRIFNTLNIQLTTTHDPQSRRTAYTLYLQNFDKLNLPDAKVTEVRDEQHGDLLAFHDTLKYLVYHPFLTKKLNHYDFILHTNSKHILNVVVIVATEKENKEKDELTQNILALYSCIKNISLFEI